MLRTFLTLTTFASMYKKKPRDETASTTTTTTTTTTATTTICICNDLRDDVSADSSKHSGEQYSSML